MKNIKYHIKKIDVNGNILKDAFVSKKEFYNSLEECLSQNVKYCNIQRKNNEIYLTLNLK